MCGIAGFIGQSSNQNLSFRLMTSLFRNLEIRGLDSAGFFGTETGAGSIVYHKEPVKSSEFVKKSSWKNLANLNLNMLIVHSRGASQGFGIPSDNKNNHPFVSSCKSIGLIHNGRIPDSEYDALTKKYEVFSKCDSEIILRIFENGKNYSDEELKDLINENTDSHTAQRLKGIQDIWSYIDKGHLACAIAERVDHSKRSLYLFRNKWRTIWLVDLRKDLGQVFFCSTPEIWTDAYNSTGISKFIKSHIKMIELPTEELWVLNVSSEEPIVKQVKKYSIISTARSMWKHEGEISVPIIKNKHVTSIISKLNENEEVQYLKLPKLLSECDSPNHTVIQAKFDPLPGNPHNYPSFNKDGNKVFPYCGDDCCGGNIADTTPEGLHRGHNFGFNHIEDKESSDTQLWKNWKDAKKTASAESNLKEIEHEWGNAPVDVKEDLDPPWDSSFPLSTAEFNQSCGNIIDVITKLKDSVENKIMNEKISESELKDLLLMMEQTELDLEGTLRVIEGY